MNRDRVIIVVLALLLLASLAGNWLLWRKSQSTAAPVAVAATPEVRKSALEERGAPGAYDIVPNPEMKGRLGRIVIAFAAEAQIKETRTEFSKVGATSLLRAEYGPVATELPPGSYDLEVSGKKISGVPVESGKDTRVHSGVLRLHGAKETRFTIHEPKVEKFIHVAYGNAELGLPAGEYEIEISGQREKVTIEPGKVTDF